MAGPQVCDVFATRHLHDLKEVAHSAHKDLHSGQSLRQDSITCTTVQCL